MIVHPYVLNLITFTNYYYELMAVLDLIVSTCHLFVNQIYYLFYELPGSNTIKRLSSESEKNNAYSLRIFLFNAINAHFEP